MEKDDMDRELFEILDTHLRNLFTDNARRNHRCGVIEPDDTSGLAAAQAAQALIDLHKNFKPMF